jgi:NTP pyrophosphatase (non-canonical NTP hydrolase)
MTTLLHDLNERDAETLRAAWTAFGPESQLDMVIEEAAELIQAIAKSRRMPYYTPGNAVQAAQVACEIADVLVCLQQVEIVMRESGVWDRVVDEHRGKIGWLKMLVKERTTFYDNEVTK